FRDDAFAQILRARSKIDGIVSRKGEQIVQKRRIDLGVGVIAHRSAGPALVEARCLAKIRELAELEPFAFVNAGGDAERLAISIQGWIEEVELLAEHFNRVIVSNGSSEFRILAGQLRFLAAKFVSLIAGGWERSQQTFTIPQAFKDSASQR